MIFYRLAIQSCWQVVQAVVCSAKDITAVVIVVQYGVALGRDNGGIGSGMNDIPLSVDNL